MENPVPTLILGSALLLVGVAMRRQKDPNASPFLISGIAILALTIALHVLVYLA
jgi:hypothetical protein